MLDIPFIQKNTFSQFHAIWRAARYLQFPVALWRLPHTQTAHLIVDLSGTVQQVEIDLEELPAGFAFSPFLNQDGSKNLFLQAHVHYTLENGLMNEPDDNLVPANYLQERKMLEKTARRFLNSQPADASAENADWDYSIPETDKADFMHLVKKGVQAIQRDDFLKVVVSRTKKIAFSNHFDPAERFIVMCETYPGAFVSLVSVPGLPVWMGASPETLISINRKQIFKTMSLAGTQKFYPHLSVGQAVWTQKEIEEQALVSRYIVNCFKKIRLREYEEVGPRTVVAGNLMHLRTDFAVDMQATSFPQLGTVMLRLLHPTSAVCGMPKEAALNFILANETHKREFYSGFLGPVNVLDETNLFVNLRCMQYLNGRAVLFAGAGITAHSDPEKEWAETEMKCQTMLGILGSQA